jgi:thioredoxin-dependent peroxiredoxin
LKNKGDESMAVQKKIDLPTIKTMEKLNKSYLKDALQEISLEYNEHAALLQKDIKKNKELKLKLKTKVKDLTVKNKKLKTQLESKQTKTLKDRMKKSNANLKAETALLTQCDTLTSLLAAELSSLNSAKKKHKALCSSINEFHKNYTVAAVVKSNKPVKSTTTQKTAATQTPPNVKQEAKQPQQNLFTSPNVNLESGQQAPSFTVKNDKNEDISLDDCSGKNVILYFYPKDDTPGCTQEAIDFEALSEQFSASNTVVIGVSRDSVESHLKFKQKHNFNFTLLADTQESLCQNYGVIKEKNRYGKMVMGIERSTFFIDSNGTIKHIWRNVRVADHAKSVLDRVNESNLVAA